MRVVSISNVAKKFATKESLIKSEDSPQGLKPHFFRATGGVAEATPFRT